MTALLILLTPVLVAWGYINQKRAAFYKANNFRNYNLLREVDTPPPKGRGILELRTG